MATYKLIASSTVGAGGASSITFSSIPQTYTDLKIVVSGRDNWSNSINSDSINIRLNSTNPSSGMRLLGSGSSASSDTNTQPAWISNANSTANTFGNSEYYIPNYTGTTQKSISVDGVAETNATTVYMGLGAILTNVTSAVTSITIVPSNGTSFDQYSTAYLYGISNA